MTIADIPIYFGIFFALYFGVFIFITTIENKKQTYYKPKKQRFPLVSLVVPCYNEAHNIDMVIDSLISLNYPKERLEIIVVDDGSIDQTYQKALDWQKKYSHQIQVFSKSNGGKYTALNLGFEHSGGEIIGSVDADCSVDKDAIWKMVNYFDNPETAIVVSTIKIMNPKNILEGIQYIEYLISAFLKKVFGFLGSISVTSGPLTLFKKSAFKTLGYYKRAHQTEDLEIAFRAQTKNMKIDYALDAIVYTKGEKTLKGLTRQRLRWRRGFLLNLKDYFCLLNLKQHGNLAFCLLYNIFGVFLSVGLTLYSLIRLLDLLISKTRQAALIRFDFSPYLADLGPSLPHLNPKPAFLLSFLCLLIMFGFLYLGKKMTFDKTPLKAKAVLYAVFYAFFNAFWWIMAGWSATFKKHVSWQ